MTEIDKEYKEKIDRIEHHLRLLKDSDTRNSTLLINIENALTGNSLNGNKGMVKQLDEIDERVEDLEKFKGEISVYVNQFKAAFIIIFGALITLIFKLFSIK